MMYERGPYIPLRYSERLFSEDIPAEHIEWVHSQARLSPLRQNVEKGIWYIIPGEEIIDPCRSISVDFGDPQLSFIYHLFETQLLAYNPDTREIKFRQWLPEEQPEAQVFNAWVAQSINQAGGHMIHRIVSDLRNCVATKSNLLTTSKFVARFLDRSFDVEDSVGVSVANSALKLRIPILSQISLRDLLKVRVSEGDSFRAFRLGLQRSLRELAHVEDRREKERKMANAEYELNELSVAEVDQEMRRIQKKIFRESTLAAVSLVAAVPTKGLSLAGVVMAMMGGYTSMTTLRDKVKANPGYFLWRLAKEL